MRVDPFNSQVQLLKYEIREIVDFVAKVKELAPNLVIHGENIGDPIKKGWPVPPFLKELIHEEIEVPGDAVFAYTHSRGYPETREWIREYARRFSPGCELDFEDVLLTSGLGAGISAVYHMLADGARILQPTPSYPTHASMESFAAGKAPISYRLDPNNNWQPDLAHMEEQIQAHPEIVGILLINPNNPTGAVYSEETLEKVIQLAEKYQLMIISDEIYFRLVYNGYHFAQITTLAKNRVPLIVMRGLSKDVPWPGGRCGWLEFHNQHLDEQFRSYVSSVKKRVLMEVCSVTLPQFLLPKIYDHPQFEAWLKDYIAGLEHNSNQIADILGTAPGLKVNKTNGAFYMMPIFEEGALNGNESLHIENADLRALVEDYSSRPGVLPDKRFCYYLVATTGICAVPASSFFSEHLGFRITTLDRNEERRKMIYSSMVDALSQFRAA